LLLSSQHPEGVLQRRLRLACRSVCFLGFLELRIQKVYRLVLIVLFTASEMCGFEHVGFRVKRRKFEASVPPRPVENIQGTVMNVMNDGLGLCVGVSITGALICVLDLSLEPSILLKDEIGDCSLGCLSHRMHGLLYLVDCTSGERFRLLEHL
jgi:hypothetical protein